MDYREALITDSSFYVPKVILETRKMEVYGNALIKKRRVWPTGVNGDVINEYFSSKNIGDFGCLSGEWVETKYNIFFEGT